MSKEAEVLPNCSDEKPKSDVSCCRSCGNLIPVNNMALHEMRCEHLSKKAPFSEKPAKKGKKTSPQKKAAKNIEESKNDENFDELLAEFVRKDTQCDQPGCGKSILTVAQTCPYCRKCFCLGHHIPEVHGCSQAAKVGARLDAVAQASGNRKQASNKEVTRKAQLHKKLETKLKNMEGKRKTKQKEKDKK